jgi:hypothetical protein
LASLEKYSSKKSFKVIHSFGITLILIGHNATSITQFLNLSLNYISYGARAISIYL